MRKIAAVVVLILITAGAFGESDAVQDGQWLRHCWQAFEMLMNNSPNRDIMHDAQYSGEYMGFVIGVSMAGNSAWWFAIPSAVTLEQECLVIGKYLDAHPEEWNLRADALVYKALVAVWPGKRKPEL